MPETNTSTAASKEFLPADRQTYTASSRRQVQTTANLQNDRPTQQLLSVGTGTCEEYGGTTGKDHAQTEGVTCFLVMIQSFLGVFFFGTLS